MQRLGLTLSGVAVLGLLVSPAARATAQQATGQQIEQARVQDVRITYNGMLRGTLHDEGGQPVVGQDVHVYHGKRFAVTTRTNDAGEFQLTHAVGGTYRFDVGGESWFCRCWIGDAAPPGAKTALAIQAGQSAPEAMILRGQKPLCCLWGGEPLMLGVLVAAAIAIPIAVHNSDSDDAS